MATKTAKKKAPAKPVEPEVEVDETVEDEDFDEIEEDEVTEEAPAKKKSGTSNDVTFGVAHLADHLSKKTKKPVTTRELRTLIRRMARDSSGRVDREIVPGNRTRYNWSGIDHPEVQAIITAFVGGEGEIEKKEKLAALKAKGDAAKAAAKTAPVKKTTKKAKPAPAVVEEDDEDEELDFDEE